MAFLSGRQLFWAVFMGYQTSCVYMVFVDLREPHQRIGGPGEVRHVSKQPLEYICVTKYYHRGPWRDRHERIPGEGKLVT